MFYLYLNFSLKVYNNIFSVYRGLLQKTSTVSAKRNMGKYNNYK